MGRVPLGRGPRVATHHSSFRGHHHHDVVLEEVILMGEIIVALVVSAFTLGVGYWVGWRDRGRLARAELKQLHTSTHERWVEHVKEWHKGW